MTGESPTEPPSPCRRKVIFVELEQKQVLDSVFPHVQNALRAKYTVQNITSTASLKKFSSETSISSIVAIFVSSISHVIRKTSLNRRLVSYAKAGGTVILCDPLLTSLAQDRLDRYFNDLWALRWTVTSFVSLAQKPFVLNEARRERLRSLQNLPESYDKSAIQIGTVREEAQVYSSTAPTSTSKTSVAFETVGEGFLGFSGAVDDSNMTRDILLVMCGAEHCIPSADDPLPTKESTKNNSYSGKGTPSLREMREDDQRRRHASQTMQQMPLGPLLLPRVSSRRLEVAQALLHQHPSSWR